MEVKMKVLLFGGSGGLGSRLLPLLQEKYDVTSMSSKDLDLTNALQVKEFFIQNSEWDVVINLSGYNYDTFIHKISCDEQTQNEIDKMLDVNIKGNINILSYALGPMRERNFGRVILTSSVLSEKIQVGTGIYSATKSFIDTLTKVANAENVNKRVTVNSIRLGYFDGGLAHKIPEKYAKIILDSIPLHRWGTIEELYNIIDFIIETEYCAGNNLTVSGGLV